MDDLKEIRNDEDLQIALQHASLLAAGDPNLGTPQGNRLDALVTLVEAYEKAHHPIEPLW